MRRFFVVLLVMLALSGCGAATPNSGGEPPRVVVVIQDAAFPDARSVVTPAVLGLALALQAVPEVRLEIVDVSLAGDVPAMHPAAVAIAPFTLVPDTVVDQLLAGDVAVVSLSELGAPPLGSGEWRRFVPPLLSQVDALVQRASVLAPRGASGIACVAGEDSTWSRAMQAAMAGLEPRLHVVGHEGRPDCSVLVWTGSAPGAIDVRDRLGTRRADPVLLLDDAARTQGFLDATMPETTGDVGLCGCVDLAGTNAISPAARLFLHDYVEVNGLDPGPFAAEGFDAGSWLAATLVGGVLPGSRSQGLGARYRWTRSGELRATPIRSYRAAGVRWVGEGPPG